MWVADPVEVTSPGTFKAEGRWSLTFAGFPTFPLFYVLGSQDPGTCVWGRSRRLPGTHRTDPGLDPTGPRRDEGHPLPARRTDETELLDHYLYDVGQVPTQSFLRLLS